MIGGKPKRKTGLIFLIAFLFVAGLSSQARAQTGSGRAGPTTQPAHQRGVHDADAQPAAAEQPAKYYALVIGNNNYQYVPKLQTPVNDANAVARVLHERYGFNTKVLLNASRVDIMTQLVLFRTSLPETSNLLIYYAGHGYLDQDVDEAYWLPVDAQRDNNMNWISADDITRGVRGIRSKHVLVISDSCYSGAILSDSMRDIGTAMRPQERLPYLSRVQGLRSRTWMASGSREPVPDHSATGDPNHSPFANGFIQGLSQMREDQFAASDLFFSYVRRKVSGVSSQLPQYGAIRNSLDGMGDFVFSRGGTALPDQPPPVIEYQGGLQPVDPTDVHPVFDPAADRILISEVLHQYELGRSHRDGNALWKLWPTAPVEIKQRLEAYFKSASSIRTTLDMGTTDVAEDHVTATVSGQIREAYTPRNGDAPPPRADSIAFTLKKNNGVWTIVDVK